MKERIRKKGYAVEWERDGKSERERAKGKKRGTEMKINKRVDRLTQKERNRKEDK